MLLIEEFQQNLALMLLILHEWYWIKWIYEKYWCMFNQLKSNKSLLIKYSHQFLVTIKLLTGQNIISVTFFTIFCLKYLKKLIFYSQPDPNEDRIDNYEPLLPNDQVRSLPPREPTPVFENKYRDNKCYKTFLGPH